MTTSLVNKVCGNLSNDDFLKPSKIFLRDDAVIKDMRFYENPSVKSILSI